MIFLTYEIDLFTSYKQRHINCIAFKCIILFRIVNKRLDDWVTEDALDTRKVQFPRKDGSTTGHNTGATTPKRQHSVNFSNLSSIINSTLSRPTSPKATDTDGELVNGNNVMAAALQKKMNRKRKVSKCYV